MHPRDARMHVVYHFNFFFFGEQASSKLPEVNQCIPINAGGGRTINVSTSTSLSVRERAGGRGHIERISSSVSSASTTAWRSHLGQQLLHTPAIARSCNACRSTAGWRFSC